MTTHYNFYESLDIDRDSSTAVIREELSGRLDALRREGTPEYDPRVQEASTALSVLGDDDKRAIHDERLDDPLAPRMGIAELRTLAATGSFSGGSTAASAPGAPAGVRPAAYPPPTQASSDDDSDDSNDSSGIGVDGSTGSAEPSPAYYSPAGQQSGPHSGPQPAYPTPQGNGPYVPGASMQQGQQQPGQQQPQFSNAPQQPKAPKAPENPDNPSLVGLVTGAPMVLKILGGVLAANTVISVVAMLIAFFNVSAEDWNTGFGYLGDIVAIGASAVVVPFLGIALTSAFLLPRVLKGRDNGVTIPLVATGVIFAMFTIALAVTYGGTMTKLLMILLTITHIAMIVLAFIPETRNWFNGTWQPASAAQGGYGKQGHTGQQPQPQYGAPQGQTAQHPQPPQQQYGAPQGRAGEYPQFGQPQQGQQPQQPQSGQ